METKTSKIAYRYYNLMVSFDGAVTFFYDLCAVDLSAAIADVAEAYGPVELVQWGVRDYPSMYTRQGCSSIETVR